VRGNFGKLQILASTRSLAPSLELVASSTEKNSSTPESQIGDTFSYQHLRSNYPAVGVPHFLDKQIPARRSRINLTDLRYVVPKHVSAYDSFR